MRIVLLEVLLHLTLVHLLTLTRRIELMLAGHVLLLQRHTTVHISLRRFGVNLRLVSSAHARATRHITPTAADISRARSVASTRLLLLLIVLMVLTSHATLVDFLRVHLLASLSRHVVLLSASAVEEHVVGHELLLAHEAGIFCRLHL